MTIETLNQNPDFVYRKWSVPRPLAVLLLVHGLGAHSRRWKYFADFFLNQSITSYALDLTGFGKRRLQGDNFQSFNCFFRDILNLYEVVRADNPDIPVFIVGESLGGLIVHEFLRRYPDLCNGAVYLSPAFANRLFFSMSSRLKFFAAVFFNSRVKIKMPFTLFDCTHDIEYAKNMESDPDESRYATVKLLANIILNQIRARLFPYRSKIPFLFLVSGQDYIVDSRTIKRVYKCFKAEDKKIIEYQGLYHALSIESQREKIFKDIGDWLKQRIIS